MLTEDSQRIEQTFSALRQLAQLPDKAAETEIRLQPTTGTILSLSADAKRNLYLPKLGTNPVMTEEETRESLRRFIRQWQELIGSDPAKLSLVERVDQPDGLKIARYEQRPFRHPIRGGFGKLQITFTSDRHVVDLTSTCIPDAERIQTALSAPGIRIRSAEAVRQLREKGVNFVDSKGMTQNFTISPASTVNPISLTTYILPAKENANALEFHTAWEIELTDAPVKFVYFDAVTGQILAVA
jgi:hypothetical protein